MEAIENALVAIKPYEDNVWKCEGGRWQVKCSR